MLMEGMNPPAIGESKKHRGIALERPVAVFFVSQALYQFAQLRELALGHAEAQVAVGTPQDLLEALVALVQIEQRMRQMVGVHTMLAHALGGRQGQLQLGLVRCVHSRPRQDPHSEIGAAVRYFGSAGHAG